MTRYDLRANLDLIYRYGDDVDLDTMSAARRYLQDDIEKAPDKEVPYIRRMITYLDMMMDESKRYVLDHRRVVLLLRAYFYEIPPSLAFEKFVLDAVFYV